MRRPYDHDRQWTSGGHAWRGGGVWVWDYVRGEGAVAKARATVSVEAQIRVPNKQQREFGVAARECSGWLHPGSGRSLGNMVVALGEVGVAARECSGWLHPASGSLGQIQRERDLGSGRRTV